MSIYELIKNTVKSLDIECYYSAAESRLDNYAIYSVDTESETEHFDNKNFAIEYNVSIKYFYKKPNQMMKYREIINAMKKNGFSFITAYDDGKKDPYYIKEMEFVYVNII